MKSGLRLLGAVALLKIARPVAATGGAAGSIAPSYGSGAYGLGAYSGYAVYLPVAERGGD